jgi:hypothetical protein
MVALWPHSITHRMRWRREHHHYIEQEAYGIHYPQKNSSSCKHTQNVRHFYLVSCVLLIVQCLYRDHHHYVLTKWLFCFFDMYFTFKIQLYASVVRVFVWVKSQNSNVSIRYSKMWPLVCEALIVLSCLVFVFRL